jgi:hypothetical protein
MKAARIGAIVLLCIAAVGAAAWFLRAPASVRYAAMAGDLSVMVMVRGGGPPPGDVTVQIGDVKVVAKKLP